MCGKPIALPCSFRGVPLGFSQPIGIVPFLFDSAAHGLRWILPGERVVVSLHSPPIDPYCYDPTTSCRSGISTNRGRYNCSHVRDSLCRLPYHPYFQTMHTHFP